MAPPKAQTPPIRDPQYITESAAGKQFESVRKDAFEYEP